MDTRQMIALPSLLLATSLTGPAARAAAPGGASWCSEASPCSEGEGDCDSDAECADGLVCGWNIGDWFDMDPSYDVCVGDSDGDTINDYVEYWLADSFRPALVMHSRETDSSREEYWAVHPTEDGASIAIALGYFEDFGSPTWFSRTSHLGDSEFIVIDVTEVSEGSWRLDRVWLSAHYEAPILFDETTWEPRGAFDFDTADGGFHPIVYVARDKHANYAGAWDCNIGINGDRCEGLDAGEMEDTYIAWDRNLGDPFSPLIETVSSGTAEEWYWKDSLPFCGWQVDSTDEADRGECAPDANSYYNQLWAWTESTL